MTLIIGLDTGDGIVVAIDTRFTYTSRTQINDKETEIHNSYLDGGHKILLSQSHKDYGIAFVGQIHQGQNRVTPEVILAEFDESFVIPNFGLSEFAIKFGAYFSERVNKDQVAGSSKPQTSFWIFGLDADDSKPKVFRLSYPDSPTPTLIMGDSSIYSFQWEGSGRPMLSRLINGVDENVDKTIRSLPGLGSDVLNKVADEIKGKFTLSVNVKILSIEDAADFAENLIQTVHFLEKYAGKLQAVGPFSDVVAITRRKGTHFIRGRVVEEK